MNECPLCKKPFDGPGDLCPECAAKTPETPIVIAKEPAIIPDLQQEPGIPPKEENKPEEPQPVPEENTEEIIPPETDPAFTLIPEETERPEDKTENKPPFSPMQNPENQEETKEPAEKSAPEKTKKRNLPEKHSLLRLAYLAANPYPALKKPAAPLWFLALLPAAGTLLSFAHIAWDKIALSYLPTGLFFVYLLAGACAGLLFTIADAGLTTGFCRLFKTGASYNPLNIAGAICLPSLYTTIFSILGLFFRLFGWGSIVFAPTAALLPLCFLLPLWLRLYKGKQLPVILTVFLSGMIRIGILHIFLNLKF